MRGSSCYCWQYCRGRSTSWYYEARTKAQDYQAQDRVAEVRRQEGTPVAAAAASPREVSPRRRRCLRCYVARSRPQTSANSTVAHRRQDVVDQKRRALAPFADPCTTGNNRVILATVVLVTPRSSTAASTPVAPAPRSRYVLSAAVTTSAPSRPNDALSSLASVPC